MGFWSFMKKVFGADDDEVDDEIIAARKRLNIEVGEGGKEEEINSAEERKKRRQEEIAQYDVWEDLKYYRQTFFLGGWASRKFGLRPESSDKLKEELEELERKREEKRRLKEEKKMRGR